jgi:phenylacetate-CoA ligase
MPADMFRIVLGTDPRISEYQVRQTATGARILVVGSPDVPTLTRAVATALRQQGLPDPDVQVELVDHLQRCSAAGKLRRFVALKENGHGSGL